MFNGNGRSFISAFEYKYAMEYCSSWEDHFFVETGIELDESSISCHYHEQLCSVPSVHPSDQDYLLPGHEYEELRGL